MSDIFSCKGRQVLTHAEASARDIVHADEGAQSLQRAGFTGSLVMALGMTFSNGISAAGVSAVQEVRDRAEIANLISALLFADDRHDAEAFAGAFVPDGLLDIKDPKAPVHAQGTEAIRGFIRGPAAPPKGGPTGASGGPGAAGMPSGPMSGIRHISFNDYIQIVDSTHAHHYSYWMSVRNAAAPRDATDRELLGIAGQDMRMLGCGIYDDDLVKVNGKWYFQVHRLRFDTVKPE